MRHFTIDQQKKPADLSVRAESNFFRRRWEEKNIRYRSAEFWSNLLCKYELSELFLHSIGENRRPKWPAVTLVIQAVYDCLFIKI